MRKFQFCGLVCATILLLATGAVWAGDPSTESNEIPAILANLDANNVTVLDDQAANEVRGQNGQDLPTTKYVLVKVLGLNALDFGRGIEWTWNPLNFRYGSWGGPGWSAGTEAPVSLAYAIAYPTADDMDEAFKNHDLHYIKGDIPLSVADMELLGALTALAVDPGGYWGRWIYDPASRPGGSLPDGLTIRYVKVSGVSFIGQRFFFGWRKMPYTEYARREALAGTAILAFGHSLIP